MSSPRITLEEPDRQLAILALALMSRLRPGFQYAARNVADLMNDGGAMFDEFYRLNDHIAPEPSIFDHPAMVGAPCKRCGSLFPIDPRALADLDKNPSHFILCPRCVAEIQVSFPCS